MLDPETNLPIIVVLDVVDEPDGTATIRLDVSDEFIEKFLKTEGLDEWDDDYFQDWFMKALEETLNAEEAKTP